MKNLFTFLALALFVSTSAFAQFGYPISNTYTATDGLHTFGPYSVTEETPYWSDDSHMALIKIDVPGATSIEVTITIATTLDNNANGDAEVFSYAITDYNTYDNTVYGGNYLIGDWTYGSLPETINGDFGGASIANGSLISLNLELYDYLDEASATATFTIEYQAFY